MKNNTCDWSCMDMWQRPLWAARECWGPVIDGLCECHTRAAGWESDAGECGDVVIRDAETGELVDYGVDPDNWETVESVLYGAGWDHPRIVYMPVTAKPDEVARIQWIININMDCYDIPAHEQDVIEFMTC